MLEGENMVAPRFQIVFPFLLYRSVGMEKNDRFVYFIYLRDFYVSRFYLLILFASDRQIFRIGWCVA